MTITISLPPETEAKLRKQAAETGLAPDAYARQLIEQGLNGGREVPSGDPASENRPGASKFDEVLAPFRKEVEESGMTHDELRQLLTEVRDEVRAEKCAGRPQGPGAR
jgi:hypothetical protein